MKLQVVHLPLAQYTAHTGSSKIYWPVSGKGVLPAPWLAWIIVDRKFVSVGSVCYSDPFFFCFSLLCYPWGHLFMGLLTFMAGEAPWCEFLFPHQHFHSNVEKQLLPNPMTYIGLMATSVCFSSSPVSIGWGGSVSGCWLLGVGSTMGSVQLCSRSFLVSLRVETAWGSPAITGLYF